MLSSREGDSDLYEIPRGQLEGMSLPQALQPRAQAAQPVRETESL